MKCLKETCLCCLFSSTHQLFQKKINLKCIYKAKNYSLSVCPLRISRTVHLIYFTRSRFITENPTNCIAVLNFVQLGHGHIQYENILN